MMHTNHANSLNARENARRQVERKLGFYSHLTVYLLVNSGLMILNLLNSPQHFWAVGPLLGWGIGLAFHGIGVFLRGAGAGWKQRMIENEMRKHH
ncbi:MAG: 2TM domain-containing protein [Pseudomonadota bacterium]